MLRDCKGIVFDLDGTLVDSMGIWSKIDRAYLERYGYEYTDEIAKIIRNKGFQALAEYFDENFDIPRTKEEMMQDWDEMSLEEYKYNIGLIAGAKDFLHHLKQRGVRLAIGTSNNKKNVSAVLAQHGITHLFDTIVTGFDVKEDKPAPDIYLEAIRRLDVKPSDAFVFEDMVVGIRAAKAAGIRVCAIEDEVNRGLRMQQAIAVDHSMRDYRDVLGVLI